MSVTSATALFARVYEVLCDGSGAARTLAASERFLRRRTSTRDRTTLSARAKGTPLIEVFPLAMSRIDSADVFTSEHDYRLTVGVRRYYHLGYESDPSAVEATLARMVTDYARTCAALEHPSNLVTTEAGADTGIGGTGFAPVDSKLERATAPGDGADRLVVMLDTYQLEWSFNPDA